MICRCVSDVELSTSMHYGQLSSWAHVIDVERLSVDLNCKERGLPVHESRALDFADKIVHGTGQACTYVLYCPYATVHMQQVSPVHMDCTVHM